MKQKQLVIILFLFTVNTGWCQAPNGGKNDLDWWQKTIFYQIYPRSFMDSDGDGIGDLKGIISKLGHLKESGVDATWLSPIFKSPMVDFGYDISDFTDIQDEYGTMEDFEALIKEANKLGIKIIVDFVPNHTSDECEWFKKSVKREPGYEDFYVWHDGRKGADGKIHPPNNWISVFEGSAWEWNKERGQYYLHQFTAGQPDLNFRNPKVLAAMDDVLQFWLSKGVAGFRVDAICHLFEVEDLRDEPESGKPNNQSYEFLEHIYTKDLPETYDVVYHWRKLLDNYKKENGGDTPVMLTEAYANISSVMDYYESKDGVQGAQVPFNFYLISDLNMNSDARDFLSNIQRWISYMPVTGTPNWVLGNHDRPRVASRFGPERADGLNLLLLTLPGIAVTYNGEEIGMVDYRDITYDETKDPAARRFGFSEDFKEISRDPVRTPFQWDDTKNAGFSTAETTWLPVHPNYENLNLAKQKSAERSTYKLYQRLANLRQHNTLRKGSFFGLAITRDVLAFKRELKGEDTFVTVINFGSQEHTVDLRYLGGLPDTLIVAAAGSGSIYREGDKPTTDSLKVGKFEALLLTTRILSGQNSRS